MLKPLFLGFLIGSFMAYLFYRRKRNKLIDTNEQAAMIHNSTAGMALGAILLSFGLLHFVLLPEVTIVMQIAGGLFIVAGVVIFIMYFMQKKARIEAYRK